MQRKRAGAALGAGLAVAVAAAVFAHGSLQQDFAAYYVAGGARRLGLDPYVNHVQPGTWTAPGASGLWDGVAPFGHSRFLYTPLVAELFRPLAALPYAVAKALFTAVALAGWLATAAMLGWAAAPVFLVAGALFFPIYLHLERGQMDLLVLPLLLLAWRWRANAAGAGAALALAALVKPATLGLLPVVAALRHVRVAAAAVAGGVVLAALTVVVSGPSLVRTYVTEVLPRATLYGEGGTEAMLLPDARFPEMREVKYREALLATPASASLPRLLAPASPSPASALAPYLAAIVALVWAARRYGPRNRDSAELMYLAGMLACVVTSPSGWVMGLVWALPLAPLVLRLRASATVPRRTTLGMGLAWIACAVPAPVPGFPALAGAALVAATIAAAATASSS